MLLVSGNLDLNKRVEILKAKLEKKKNERKEFEKILEKKISEVRKIKIELEKLKVDKEDEGERKAALDRRESEDSGRERDRKMERPR